MFGVLPRLRIIGIVPVDHLVLFAVTELAAKGSIVFLVGLVVFDGALVNIVIVAILWGFHLHG